MPTIDEELIDNFIESDDEVIDEGRKKYEHFRFEVDKGQGALRIDKYLVNVMPGVSRNRIQEATVAGCVMVNGMPVRSSYKVKPLDSISILLDYPPTDYEVVPQDIPIDIVYEDNDIIVVNKQAGMVVHPGYGNHEGTLLNAVAWHLKDDPAFDANDKRVGLVHRIDKDTSGLLLIAKTPEAKTHLGLQFYNKTTHRRYQAVVWGIVKDDQGTIQGDIGRHTIDRTRFTVFPEGENPVAKHAVTHYKVLERITYVTLVECRLETGRTHQIRVHMKHIGHTLFNDERYEGNLILKGVNSIRYKLFVKNCFACCPRQALHAKSLGFVHPRTGEEMMFDSELPADMQELLRRWRGYSFTLNKPGT